MRFLLTPNRSISWPAPERLWLCHRGQEIPLAEFLNPVDARKLRVVLESQGLRVERRSRSEVEVRL